jgi:hypothetical protein
MIKGQPGRGAEKVKALSLAVSYLVLDTGLEIGRIILLGIKNTRENSSLSLLLDLGKETGLEMARMFLLGIKNTRENSSLSLRSVTHFTHGNSQ